MDVRAHISMVFHLDKCIGCHTCSIACKNIWTDRCGAEYMWWNNVETKPGTGFPTQWEDQGKYRGGWEVAGGELRLRSMSKSRSVTDLFHHPYQPTLDDYYEPWTYDFQNLFNAPEGDDQPTARPLSMVSGKPMSIKAGPNWDDDLGGSPVYAANDPNLSGLSAEQRAQLFAVERLSMFYFPRICNHCVNPGCVASCPSGALHKRGEDGIVLIDQKRCRAWRACVAACPYKKAFYNWQTGKSEKCILCFPRVETGQAPACFHSCVGRIRYLGVLLYDADRLAAAAALPDEELIEAQRDMILDPRDPQVIAGARRNGIHDSVIESAQESPVYLFVKVWKLALPPHPEFRTLPMLFYVPPLSPVLSSKRDPPPASGSRPAPPGTAVPCRQAVVRNSTETLFHEVDNARAPLAYLAKLFGAGHVAKVRYALKKQMAVRIHRRATTVGDLDRAAADRALVDADCDAEQAEAIYKLTALSSFEDRFVIPPSHREMAIEMLEDPQERKQAAGFGFVSGPKRGA